MARFVYRLQKVYELRERKKKEQEQRVIEANAKVRDIETMIEAKKNEIDLVQKNMFSASHMLMKEHDEYLHRLNDDLDHLNQDLNLAKQELAHERQLLVKAQADLEALEKHKAKAREAWQEEEKRQEMKALDEVSVQRYFRNQLNEMAEAAEEQLLAEEAALEESQSMETVDWNAAPDETTLKTNVDINKHAIERHRDSAHENWQQEEYRMEQRQMDEIALQQFHRKKKGQEEEDENREKRQQPGTGKTPRATQPQQLLQSPKQKDTPTHE